MPLKLELTVDREGLTTFDFPKAGLSLENTGPEPRDLPGPMDQSGALRLDFYRPGGTLARSVSGLTHQDMMTSGRLDPRPDLDVLGAGETWTWDVDLASWHYSLREGGYEVEAVYRHSPDAEEVRSGRVALSVEGEDLRNVTWLRDNPVLDGVAAILHAGRKGEDRYLLRQHNTQRPMAAWYSGPLPLGTGVGTPFLATTGFFSTESFEPFFRKWVLWQEGGNLCAQSFLEGVPGDPGYRFELPDGKTPLKSAYWTEDERLFVFLKGPGATITLCEFTEKRLEEVFEHEGPGFGDTEPVIQADVEFIHMAHPFNGVVYDRVNLDGGLRNRVQMYETGLAPHHIRFDPVERRIFALFGDEETAQMAVLGPKPDEIDEKTIHPIHLCGEVRELDFDLDRRGRFHLLVSTSLGRLYYYRDGKGPYLIATGERRFFPHVVAPDRAYLGFFERALGYRLYEYDPRGPYPGLRRYRDQA